MKAIVAVDKNWAIGYKGKLLERIPEDMRFLKQITMGKTIVMGRATFESLPGKEPLKGRTNIVLSTNKDYYHPGIIICRSLEELFKVTSKYAAEEIFVLGGAQIYAELLPYCSEVYITKFKNTYPADSFFPNLDKDDNIWTPEIMSESMEYNGLQYSRVKYSNTKIV